jgi:hypothetical protein
VQTHLKSVREVQPFAAAAFVMHCTVQASRVVPAAVEAGAAAELESDTCALTPTATAVNTMKSLESIVVR